jgi:hypothetical protein
MDEGSGRASRPAPRRGRLRPRENEPPPLWFGLVFALVGGSTLAFGVSLGLPVVVAFGLFFGAIGVAMTLTTMTAERGRSAFAAPGQRGSVDVFTRSPMRILMDLVLAPLGGIAFLGFSLVWPLLGGPVGLIGTAMFVFFGVFMLLGAAVTMRRGIRRAVAEVGPAGIWTPELPRRLAWHEIERVELESAIGAAGESGLATYRRLGIWPRGATLAPPAPVRAGIGMARFFGGLVKSMRPGVGLSDPSRMAPFGIQAFEIEQDLAEVIRSVERYVEVGGVRRGEEEVAEASSVPPTPALDGLPGAITANLARRAGYAATVPESLAEAGPVAPTSPLEAPGGLVESGPLTFRRRAEGVSIGRLWSDAWGSLFAVMFAVLWFGFQVVAPGLPAEAWFILLAFDLGVLAFLGFGIAGLLELPGRWRLGRGDAVLAIVDELGMELRGMGRLRWGQIAEARVVTSSIPVNEGSPAIRRLEIVPLDPARLEERPWSDRAYDRFQAFTRRLNPLRRGSARAPGAFSLDLDLLEDGEGLLDAIARYRLVDERGRG